MKTPYIGLTIGPIYQVIKSARRTRMTWAGSYFFSYMIRELAFKYLGEHIRGFEGKLVLPAKLVQDADLTMGAGIYPDRIIFQAEEGDFERTQEAISSLLRQVAADIHSHVRETPWGHEQSRKTDAPAIEAYLHDFIKLYFIELPIAASKDAEGNILLRLYKRLDVLELRDKVVVDGQQDYLQHFLFRVNKLSRNRQTSFLQKDAFGAQNPRRRFESLMEISTRGLSRIRGYDPNTRLESVLDGLKVNYGQLIRGNAYEQLVELMITRFQVAEDEVRAQIPEGEEDNEVAQEYFLHALSRYYGPHFQEYHKYIAVIHADGDNIGKLLEKIGNDPERLRQFSAKLIDFNVDAVKIAVDYGAAPVYIGGEDLFLFAPVACLSLPDAGGNQRLKTVFDLVSELDAAFSGLFEKEVEELGLDPAPTLSWGIAVGYYKHPLIDTMGHAYRLLHDAKDKTKHPDKNTICYRVQSHSGQYYEAAVEKHRKPSWKQFQAMLQDLACAPGESGAEDKAKLIHGITHRFKDSLFGTLLGASVAHNSVGTLIDNHFNEPFHRRPENKAYLGELEQLAVASYGDYGATQGAAPNFLYSALRFIDFVDSKPQED